jgi:hypothetical protein
MIIVRLTGGLGNQLFQYALARVLAERNSSAFKIDASWFDDPKHIPRKYTLNKFNILESFATQAEIDKITWRNKSGPLKTIFNFVQENKPYFRKKVVREKNFSFDPDMFKVPGTAYLDGYWQSEKYFSALEDIIRREFTLAVSLDKINLEFAQQIESSNSISIHIRRCDFIEDPETLSVHGALGLDYYSRAINYISKKDQDPRFCVFSDDYEWAKQSLKIDYPVTFVKHNNAEKDYADLWLMSLCKHHIIANSTFSWWGAWLNTNPDKIILAPERWFADEEMNNHTQDLIPETWIRL